MAVDCTEVGDGVGREGVLVGGTSVTVAGISVAVLWIGCIVHASRLRNNGISASIFFIFFSMRDETMKGLARFPEMRLIYCIRGVTQRSRPTRKN